MAVSEFTQLLEAVEARDPEASTQLLPLVYEELRRLAAHQLAKEPSGQTLQATALVHEAWLRLTGPDADRVWHGRSHFFHAAAEAMRRILVDRARKRRRERHGGLLQRAEVDLDNVTVATADSDDTVLAIHEALERLTQVSARKSQIVQLRYFIGLENAEIARIVGVSEPTVERDLAYSRAWLYVDLKKTDHGGPAG